MKTFIFACMVAVFLTISVTAKGLEIYNSGEYEPISSYVGDTISIDESPPLPFPDPGTHVEALPGGYIDGAVYLYNVSRFSLNGGSVDGRILAHDNSLVDIMSGIITPPDEHTFFAYENSLIRFYGTDFSVDGKSVSYGDSLKDYVEFNGTFYGGTTITGKLMDGNTISGKFYIYNNADMVVIPEPCTLMLLCLGGLIIRKHEN